MEIPNPAERLEGVLDDADTERIFKAAIFTETILAILWLTVELWPF